MKRRAMVIAAAGAVAVLAGGGLAASAAVASTPAPTRVVHQVDVRDSDRPGVCDGTPHPSSSTVPHPHGTYPHGADMHDRMGEHHGVEDDGS